MRECASALDCNALYDGSFEEIARATGRSQRRVRMVEVGGCEEAGSQTWCFFECAATLLIDGGS